MVHKTTNYHHQINYICTDCHVLSLSVNFLAIACLNYIETFCKVKRSNMILSVLCDSRHLFTFQCVQSHVSSTSPIVCCHPMPPISSLSYYPSHALPFSFKTKLIHHSFEFYACLNFIHACGPGSGC